MAGNKNVNPDKSGKVTYNANILKGIVALAVSEVAGVAIKKGKKDKLNLMKIVFDGDTVNIDITVDAIYGYNVPDIAFNIQQSIKYNVESMSKYKVDSVDVHFNGVIFDDKNID